MKYFSGAVRWPGGPVSEERGGWREWGWKVLLVIAVTAWVIGVELRLNISKGLHRSTTRFLSDHDEMFAKHTKAIGELQRIHIYELEEVLEEVRRWEEYYDRPAGSAEQPPKSMESKGSK